MMGQSNLRHLLKRARVSLRKKARGTRGAATRAKNRSHVQSQYLSRVLGHDPEQCLAVFQKDHAQSKTAMTVQPNLIALQDHLLSASRSRCGRKSAIERRLAEISDRAFPKSGLLIWKFVQRPAPSTA